MEKFNSEYGEDAWIAANVPLPERGVYVDAGCGHPVQFNNTAFLRARGWSGVAIDGNPAYGPEWAQFAPEAVFEPAVLAVDRKVRFQIVPENSAISRLSETGEMMQAFQIWEILIKHGITKINFLSLDLEGAEYDVIRTLDLCRFDPDIIVAEYDTAGIGQDLRLHRWLTAHWGYKEVHRTVSNIIFVRKEAF